MQHPNWPYFAIGFFGPLIFGLLVYGLVWFSHYIDKRNGR